MSWKDLDIIFSNISSVPFLSSLLWLHLHMVGSHDIVPQSCEALLNFLKQILQWIVQQFKNLHVCVSCLIALLAKLSKCSSFRSTVWKFLIFLYSHVISSTAQLSIDCYLIGRDSSRPFTGPFPKNPSAFVLTQLFFSTKRKPLVWLLIFSVTTHCL